MKRVQFIRQWTSHAPGSTAELDTPVADLLIGRSIAKEVEQAVVPGPSETADAKPRKKAKPRKQAKPKAAGNG